MIVNEREIFQKKKCGRRNFKNSYSISWNCKNTHNCNATLVSTRDFVEIDGSDYIVLRNIVHNCSTSRTVVVLKRLNYHMEQWKEPGVNQQVRYEGVLNHLLILYAILMWVKQFKDGYQRMDYKYSITKNIYY